MNQTSKRPLYLPPVSINADQPAFHGDLFSRANLAARLTDCIDRLPSGGVIAIDAPWGEGKSWFGQHWHNKLKEYGYRTAFINAFERDYVEEPFVMLVSELLTSLDTAEKSKLKRSGVAVAKAIAPLAVKSAINAVAQLATGTTNFSEKIDEQLEKAGDAIAAGVEKLLSKQIEDYENSKVAVTGFRKTLGELASAQDKPIVIFVDELDRCRPEFAVKLIERIKHFFEMPNIVFVLLLNHDQLSKAVKGVYGQDVDGSRYLSKFLNLTLILPKVQNYRENDTARKFTEFQIQRYGFDVRSPVIQRWTHSLAGLSNAVNLSLREIEQATTLFNLANPPEYLYPALPWVIYYKLRNSEIFLGLLTDDVSAHRHALTVLESQTRLRYEHKFYEYLYEIHHAKANHAELSADSKCAQWIQSLWQQDDINFKTLFPVLCSQVHFSIR